MNEAIVVSTPNRLRVEVDIQTDQNVSSRQVADRDIYKDKFPLICGDRLIRIVAMYCTVHLSYPYKFKMRPCDGSNRRPCLPDRTTASYTTDRPTDFNARVKQLLKWKEKKEKNPTSVECQGYVGKLSQPVYQ